MDQSVFGLMQGEAIKFLSKNVSYSFTKAESDVINVFFTNRDKKVFSIRLLPDSMKATLLSMYSRLKNDRGIRGHFVDNLMPVILASRMGEFDNRPTKMIEEFLKNNNLKTLDAFICFNRETKKVWDEFYSSILCINWEYYESFSSSKKVNEFLSVWLGEKFGHNSIARMASVTICFEQISVLAAKTIEWVRPGSGFIELSTRFVSMESADVYPIWDELEYISHELAEDVKRVILSQFETYKKSMTQFDPDSFETYLVSNFATKIPDPAELKRAVEGEKCDVLGNLLPCATLTSLGITVSGEAIQSLLKHLILDKTPENYAIHDFIIHELEITGNKAFVRHTEVTEYEEECWKYIDSKKEECFVDIHKVPWTEITRAKIPDPEQALFNNVEKHLVSPWPDGPYSKEKRGQYEKLPALFESLTATFAGIMSFRSWRDLHRHGFCMHFRTVVNPEIGFYRYHKGVVEPISSLFADAHKIAQGVYARMMQFHVPDEIMQYAMPMGCFVGFVVSANLREWEFIEFQRTKFTVNDEVRKIVIFIGRQLRRAYHGWDTISRADKTFSYAFARTKVGIPLDDDSSNPSF